MFRKSLVIFATSLFLIFSLVTMDAYAKGKPRTCWNPFKAIWVKIFDHEERITNLEEKAPVVGIEVYDADGQYLGVLVNFDSANRGSAYVFMPSLGITARISLVSGDINRGYILFDDANCTGVPYQYPHNTYIPIKNGSKYYIGEESAPITEIQVYSVSYSDGSCSADIYTAQDVVPLQEFDIEQLPFNLSVALPLSFKFD